MQDEPALLWAAKKLDRDALIAVFDQYAPAVYNFAYRWCHDAVEADKIVGDTFFTLLEQLSAGKALWSIYGHTFFKLPITGSQIRYVTTTI